MPALPITQDHFITLKSSSIFSSVFSGPLPAQISHWTFRISKFTVQLVTGPSEIQKEQFLISSFRFFPIIF
jgi:hypothetical protein